MLLFHTVCSSKLREVIPTCFQLCDDAVASEQMLCAYDEKHLLPIVKIRFCRIRNYSVSFREKDTVIIGECRRIV